MALVHALQSTWAACLLRQTRCISSTTCLRGIEEFFDTPRKEGDPPRVIGRAWKASELRQKSWDDLHKLWYVLLKERNMLAAERLRCKAKGEAMQDIARITKVRKGMNRIKQVLSGRLTEHEQPLVREQLKSILDAM